MTRRSSISAAALGIVASLAFASCSDAAGGRLHGEPTTKSYALSLDGSKMIVLLKRGRRGFYDIVDTRSGESRGLFEQSFVTMSWGEDSDTAYASARGKIYRLSLAEGGTSVATIGLTGERGIPQGERPRVVRFPTQLAPVLFVHGGERLYRCALDPAADGAEIAARCEFADGDAGRVVRWLITAEGRIAARIVLTPSGEHEFQAGTGEAGWRPVFRHTPGYTVLRTIGGVQKDDTVWALSNRGRERVALVRIDVATGVEVVVHEHRHVDIDGAIVAFDEAGEGSPLLASQFPGYQEVVHFDARLEAAYAALREKLGERIRIDFTSTDRALKFVVVEVLSPEIYRRWYLLDLEEKTSRELSAGRLAGYDRPAAPSRPVSFAASDGLALHGYLTLPGSPDDSGPPPMVLMLHGGPWERERWPASPLVRFLGSRGYAVLRLNYRGSTGYGRDFIEAGRGMLSGRVQQDVLDAARWAVAEGHAAQDRIALFGGSFGGFLALATLGRHPGTFRAGVALNAVIDAVAFWKRDWARDDARALWQEFLASRDLPEAELARLSPINNVRNFDAPILLLAGARDRRVPPEHSFELFDLLRAAGKPAELVEYRGSGHDIWNTSAETREHIAGSLTEFLDRYLPVEPQ